MSFSLEESIEREKAVLQSFFQEKLDLEFYDLRHTYAQFRLRAVDDIPVKSKILLDFYDDKAYLPMNARTNYVGKLDVFIMGHLFPSKESCIGSHNISFSKFAYQNRENVKLSVIDFVREASAFKFEKYNNVSGVLRKTDDLEYADQRCMAHLGRALPSLKDRIQETSLHIAEKASKQVESSVKMKDTPFEL